METEGRGVQQELEKKLKEVMNFLAESRNRVKELEALSESKSLGWTKKEHIYQIFTEFQLGALRVCLSLCYLSFLWLSDLGVMFDLI